MAIHEELIEAMDAVLAATNQPEEFKSRLRALIRNAIESGAEDHDVAGLVASVDTKTDTGH